MKALIAALILIAPLVLSTVYAATAQQSKMGSCNKDATGKTGDERKAFMKSCLSAKAPAAEEAKVEPGAAVSAPASAPASAPITQQDKMKRCNVDAKGMKGDDRKKFMSECLKKKA